MGGESDKEFGSAEPVEPAFCNSGATPPGKQFLFPDVPHESGWSGGAAGCRHEERYSHPAEPGHEEGHGGGRGGA